MPDFSPRIETVTIVRGTDPIESTLPGDRVMSVILDPDTVNSHRVYAIWRDHQLAVFPDSRPSRNDIDKMRFPIAGTMPKHDALWNGHIREASALPRLHFSIAPDWPRAWERAGAIAAPKPPIGPDPKRPYDPQEPPETGVWGRRAWEDANGKIHLVEGPGESRGPIERFLAEIKPFIEKMAAITETPLQVQVVNEKPLKTEVEFGIRTGSPGPGVPPSPVTYTAAERDRLLRGRDSEWSHEGSWMRVDDGRVRLNLTSDEFRELIVWHVARALDDAHENYLVSGMTNEARRKIPDDACRRVFTEVRKGYVVSGRNLGVAP